MPTPPPNFHFHDLRPPADDFRSAVLEGLARTPRGLSPKFFYDARGSALFDAITELPEYYPTRTEIGLLTQHGREMADWVGSERALIELGSGSEIKIRALLGALRPRAYLPIDISGEHLRRAAATIAHDHPDIAVHAINADYTQPFALPEAIAGLPRAAFYPGSSIGNFDPAQAVRLLAGVARILGRNGRLLIGVDLKKDSARLNAAYDDAQGVTAQFNLNLLVRMREELGAEVDPAAFRHHAFYNEGQGRIEMHLVADQATAIALDGQHFTFAAGDGIHTENSYKYTVEEFTALAGQAGFVQRHLWCDAEGMFSVHGFEVG